MSTPPFDCLVAGDANADLLVEGPLSLAVGTEKLASDISLVLGGSSAITAFNLSRLGARVAFASVIGRDSFGQIVETKLARGGVDLRFLRHDDRVKTGVTIWHTKKGKRAGITYPGTIAMLKAEDLTDDVLTTARHLHMGAYFLQTAFHNHAPRIFARAKELGLSTSLDTNYDPAEQWRSNLDSLLPHIDFFFPNDDEAGQITGKRNAQAAARELARLAQTVVVKRGAKGVAVANSQGTFELPARRVKVVDTTGAGDTFNAGFLARFLAGGNIQSCAKAGIAAGARCVQAVGGTAAFE